MVTSFAAKCQTLPKSFTASAEANIKDGLSHWLEQLDSFSGKPYVPHVFLALDISEC
jgi:hypothetical protein